MGRQHRMSRCATGWIASKLAPLLIEEGEVDDLEGITDDRCDGAVVGGGNVLDVPLGQQQTVDAEADTWANTWQQGVVGNMPLWPADLGEAMPEPSVDKFRDACNSFPCATGLGWDKMHPKALAR